MTINSEEIKLPQMLESRHRGKPDKPLGYGYEATFGWVFGVAGWCLGFEENSWTACEPNSLLRYS